MAAQMYYESDCDPSIIRNRKVAIIGYGSQGHAHALNLKESGVQVVVGLREGSPSRAKAEAAGLRVLPTAEAAKTADIVMILLPDEQIADVERDGQSVLLVQRRLAVALLELVALPAPIDVVDQRDIDRGEAEALQAVLEGAHDAVIQAFAKWALERRTVRGSRPAPVDTGRQRAERKARSAGQSCAGGKISHELRLGADRPDRSGL